MAMTDDQVREESHALALYLSLFSDKNGTTFDAFDKSKGDIRAAPAVLSQIDPNVFRNAWTVISASSASKDKHKEAVSAFLENFQAVSRKATGLSYPDDPDACPAAKTVGKLLV